MKKDKRNKNISAFPHHSRVTMDACMYSRAAFGLLKKIMNYLPLKQRLLHYNALIRPVINYASVLWTNGDKESLERVLKFQKRAARVMMNAHPQAPSVPLFNRLNI